MFKRGLLWIISNIAVIAVISIILYVTGLDKALGGAQGMLPMLLAASVVGFAGSLISLMMSKTMAIRGMGVRVIKSPENELEAWLVATIERQAAALNIGMPDVGIFDSPDPNAFATGARKNSALVAVSTGLLRTMNRDEVEAVLGHEMAHVANGDMVTLTLIQGIVNTFVVFFSRIIANVVTAALSKSDEENSSSGGIYFLVVMVLQVVFGFLASIIVAYFSRVREFKADEGGADLAGSYKMIAALKALQREHATEDLPGTMAAFGITGGVAKLFSTHPPLEKRIEALQNRVKG